MDLKLTLEARGWRVLGPAATVKNALLLLDDELPTVALLGRERRNVGSREIVMEITPLLIIVLIVMLLGGGWYGRGRWY